MPTYPLTFPAIGIRSSSMRLVNAVSKNVSPFTFRNQVYKFPGQRWEIDVEFRATRHNEVGVIKAFMADLNGQYGTFLYGDPDFLAKGPNGLYGGTPLVNGAGQTGNALILDGASASVVKWAKAGDYFQIGTGTLARLHMITEDADSSAGGAVTLKFQPALRYSPSDNQAVVFAGAKGLFRMAGNDALWSSNNVSIYDTGFSMVEAIGE